MGPGILPLRDSGVDLTHPGSQCSEGYSLRRDCMICEEGSFANLKDLNHKT